MFKQIEGSNVLIQQQGTYTVHDLYTRADGSLWAAIGTKKFIRLKANGSTSRVSGSIDTLEFEGALYADKFGRLSVTGGQGRKALTSVAADKLTLPRE